MRDISSNDKINLTFIDLTVTAIHHCLLAWKLPKFRVPLEFSLEVGAQRKCDTTNINHTVSLYMHRCILLSQHRFLHVHMRGSSQKDRQYLQQHSQRDPPNWIRPSDGTASQWSGQLWSKLPWISPSGPHGAEQWFFQQSQQLCSHY